MMSEIFYQLSRGTFTACVSRAVGMSGNSQDDAGFAVSVRSRYAK